MSTWSLALLAAKAYLVAVIVTLWATTLREIWRGEAE